MQLSGIQSFIKGLLLTVLLSTTACETAPPVQEMSDARQAIAVAREAGAAERAAFHLNEHAYSEARRDAKQAKMKALDALKASELTPDQD